MRAQRRFAAAALAAAAACAAFLLLGGASLPAGPAAGPPPYPLPGEGPFGERAAAISDGMSLEEAAAQVLLVGLEGSGAPSAKDLRLLERLPVGGIILFGFNMPAKPADLAAYTAAAQDAAASAPGRLPLVVALDHEGGSVFRFKGSGVTRIPPAAEVGARGPAYALALGRIGGEQLRALGVNMALAPVVELLDDANQRFLGSRSYGRDAAIVDAAAGAYLEGLQAAGTAAVAKHFPGNAEADPHQKLPSLPIGLEAYERDYEPRFAAAIGRGVAGVMLSHVLCPALDPVKPATLSEACARRALKEKLGFRGVVLTDDLYMKALSADSPPSRSAVEALAAGADLLMLSWNGEAEKVRDAIAQAARSGRLDRARLRDAARRIVELKLRFRLEEDLDPAIRARRAADFPALAAKGEAALRSPGG